MENKFVLVTGASSGIGRETSIRLSAEHRLILAGRDSLRLAETRDACTDPDKHKVWQQDFSDSAVISQSLVDFLLKIGGSVSCFVHCAGVAKALPARGTELRHIEELMKVNFFAANEILRPLLKKKVNQGSLRSIVLISSIWSHFGSRGHSAYCASKGALESWGRALATELAPEVRVNSIVAGAVKTPMAKARLEDPAELEKLRQGYLLGLGEPSDIANLIRFLVSEDSRWITGQSLIVDGGKTSHMS